MGPDDQAFDEELRTNLAINVRERIERGEDPAAARRAALSARAGHRGQRRRDGVADARAARVTRGRPSRASVRMRACEGRSSLPQLC